MVKKMNKIILALICLLVISVGVGCVAASNDITNITSSDDFIQNDDQHISVDKADNMTVAVQNATAVENSTVQNETVDNTVSVNNTNKTSAPDIVGPNETELDNKYPVVEKIDTSEVFNDTQKYYKKFYNYTDVDQLTPDILSSLSYSDRVRIISNVRNGDKKIGNVRNFKISISLNEPGRRMEGISSMELMKIKQMCSNNLTAELISLKEMN